MPLYDNTVGRFAVAPAVRTNGTVNGPAVNLGTWGADSALVVVVTGTVTDGSHAVAIEESASGTGGWSAVPAGRLTAAAPTITSANGNTQFETGVTPAQPFLRVSVTTTGATTGGALAAVIVAGEPGTTPVAH
jgi:hypothetical protein